jgi:hypothetical protein
MKFNILCDSEWDSMVSTALRELSRTGYRSLFEERDYGPGLRGLIVGFICRDPGLKFKRRIRFVKKEKNLYMDIMLSLDQMRHAKPDVRKRMILERLSEEVPTTLHKYVIPNFDAARFIADLNSWLKGIS